MAHRKSCLHGVGTKILGVRAELWMRRGRCTYCTVVCTAAELYRTATHSITWCGALHYTTVCTAAGLQPTTVLQRTPSTPPHTHAARIKLATRPRDKYVRTRTAPYRHFPNPAHPPPLTNPARSSRSSHDRAARRPQSSRTPKTYLGVVPRSPSLNTTSRAMTRATGEESNEQGSSAPLAGQSRPRSRAVQG